MSDALLVELHTEELPPKSLRALAEAFARAKGKDEAMLDGIDDVYIQWYRIVVPVKLGERKYPDLPEFDEYIRKQYGL